MSDTPFFFSRDIKGNTVSAVGAGLVDLLIYAEDNLISEIGVEKGGMTLVDICVIEKLLDKVDSVPIVVPGGAACNTAVGVGELGGFSRFIGKLGTDSAGEFFKNSLINHNVEPSLLTSKLPTGKVLSIITPDAQRTMLTSLGAASEIFPQEIVPEYFEGSKFVHVEGYLAFNPELMIKVLEVAKNSGALISLDLASFTVVKEAFELFNEIIPKYVDILLANEDEAREYTGCTDDMCALMSMAEYVELAALKVGKRGSHINYRGDNFRVQPYKTGKAIDTTGAGDLWASGLLFGLLNEFSIQDCGKIASMCGGEVCRVVGASINDEGWSRIKNIILQLCD